MGVQLGQVIGYIAVVNVRNKLDTRQDRVMTNDMVGGGGVGGG